MQRGAVGRDVRGRRGSADPLDHPLDLAGRVDRPTHALARVERLQLQGRREHASARPRTRPAGPVCSARAPRSPRSTPSTTARHQTSPVSNGVEIPDGGRGPQIAPAEQVGGLPQGIGERPDPPGGVHFAHRLANGGVSAVSKRQDRLRCAGREPAMPGDDRSRRLHLGHGAQAYPQVVGKLIQPHAMSQRRLDAGRLGVRAGRQPTVGQQHREIGRTHPNPTPGRRSEPRPLPSFLSLYPGSFLGTVRVSHVYVGNRQAAAGVGTAGQKSW